MGLRRQPGRVWSDARPPFAFAGGRGLNTTSLAKGRHVLAVRATGSAGTAEQRVVVHVANRVFALTTAHVRRWQKVRGTLRISARVCGARTTGIGLYVDGHVVSRDRAAPFRLRWDSRRMRDGLHRISLVAASVDSRTARRRLPVVVANRLRKVRSAPPRIVAESVADGQTVTGPVLWHVHTVTVDPPAAAAAP